MADSSNSEFVKDILTPFTKSLLADPVTLTPEDLSQAVRYIIEGQASDIQVASFLTALRVRGLDHQAAYIAAAARTVLEYSHTVDPLKVCSRGYVDIVGTGGDGQNTFNVSTSSAIVAAGMGLDICKHGGKASTSASGAGDLMKYLGVDLFKVNNLTTPKIVLNSKFCFLFAPSFHPGMAKVAKIRSNLGIPSIFNILGPLLNPVPLRARIIGVYTESLGQVFAEAVLTMDKANSGNRPIGSTMIVWGECGLDEISPCGYTKVWKVEPLTGIITQFRISPADFGLQEHDLESVRSGTPQENATLLKKILNNKVQIGDPIYDYILMNAGALAVVSGLASTWKEGVNHAQTAIQNGSAAQALEKFISSVNKV
ncbi:hypothetical protein PACTADRAFT_50094 [Pachysolen tannophilus NRRL Y-2460]|uniref:Anthranilate phosphoribosyltransferase n=1 Tax=Pachysolen tannophilus NRRL Y-2460 TaxID=669874 RepID=A0A1E4TUD3_PACTA|nr:hypothetical protein PACTADRAFT_50094 [Pachysolen tannophilus NRRL Y-2460]